MINVAPFEHCLCQKMGNTLDLCDAVLTFCEKGKKVKLEIRQNEEAKALVLDGCVFQDNELKCDGLFLFRSGNKKFAEKAFIVSNGMLSKPERESLENQHGIRVREVLHCEATTPVPDLRQYLL